MYMHISRLYKYIIIRVIFHSAEALCSLDTRVKKLGEEGGVLQSQLNDLHAQLVS